MLNILKELNIGKASGPDGIHNRILREGAHQLVKPLCDLFNASLSLCILPSSWKISNVCPIFKSGDPSIPSNYRSVSLLNIAEKVFERIVYNHVFSYLRGINFFTLIQSGFLPGDSTVNQTLTLYHKICRALDNGHEYRMIFFDVSKAFDKVWHKGVLFKFYHARVRGILLKWFTAYLFNQQQRLF